VRPKAYSPGTLDDQPLSLQHELFLTESRLGGRHCLHQQRYVVAASTGLTSRRISHCPLIRHHPYWERVNCQRTDFLVMPWHKQA